jgi:prepilin-type N-terminal cleavage/methylation domain-containing protein
MLRRRSDNGFTLIELLVAVVIIGIISIPLGNTMIGIIRNTDATQQRMALSHDAQISTAYFAQDVATLGTRDSTAPGSPMKPSVQLNVAYNAGPTCGSAGTPAAVVRFLADDYDTSVSPPALRTAVVAYIVVTSGTERQLHRLKCLGSSTPASDVVLAHNLDSSGPSVSCDQPVVCDGTPVPNKVTLTFSVIASASTPYQIVLNGQRRQT